jgi:hypothetical protein
MSEKRNAIQTCINWANDSTNVFRQGTAEAAQRELAAYQAIAEAAREYITACESAAVTQEWKDYSKTDKLFHKLADALQAVDRKPGG